MFPASRGPLRAQQHLHRYTSARLRAIALQPRASPELLARAQALELSVACLSFDFVGTSVEDWAEDVATLQIPAPWRSYLEDLSTLQLYTDYYFAAAPPLSNTALESLVRCASVRRSLFSSEETRLAFLSALVNITLRVLQVRLAFLSALVNITLRVLQVRPPSPAARRMLDTGAVHAALAVLRAWGTGRHMPEGLECALPPKAVEAHAGRAADCFDTVFAHACRRAPPPSPCAPLWPPHGAPKLPLRAATPA